MPWHVSQAYKIESHEHSVFFGSVSSVGPICWGFRKYGMAVEWGLGMQKPASTSSRSVDPNLGDVPSNEIQLCGLQTCRD